MGTKYKMAINDLETQMLQGNQALGLDMDEPDDLMMADGGDMMESKAAAPKDRVRHGRVLKDKPDEKKPKNMTDRLTELYGTKKPEDKKKKPSKDGPASDARDVVDKMTPGQRVKQSQLDELVMHMDDTENLLAKLRKANKKKDRDLKELQAKDEHLQDKADMLALQLSIANNKLGDTTDPEATMPKDEEGKPTTNV